MDVEILTIGDELLLGQTIDTNSAFIALKLSEIGLIPKYKSTCGDHVDDIEKAIKLAVKRSRLIITTGGLGPTDDDNTKKAIVKVFQRRLILDDKILGDIRARYKKRGIEMPAINENQALIPSGSHTFKNRLGSASGIGIIENNFVFIALPGVPTEMKVMIREEIIPFLTTKNFQKPATIVTLKTNGLFESQLAEIIAPDLKLETGVRLAYLPGFSGVDLRIVAVGGDNMTAQEKAQKLVEHIESKIGPYIYGRDNDTLPSVIGSQLKKNKKSISTAESCTGGELGEMITSVAGSSNYYLGGIVAYANEVKIRQLNVSSETLDKHGAVSEECAVEMAVGCRKLFESDYSLSITGIAGPNGGTADKPVGTIFIGLLSDKKNLVKHYNFGVDRESVRARACYAALEMLRRELLGIK